MKRELTLLAGGAAGALAALLVRRRRTEPGAAPLPTVAGGDPRADLRRKLAEAREAPVGEEEFEVAGMSAETVVGEADEPPRDVDALRRRVHDEARAAAEEMKRREAEG